MSAAADGDGEASPPVAEQCQETQQCITSTGEVRPAASPTEELLCVTEELLLVLDATPVPDGLQLDDERHVVVAIAVDAPRVFPQRCWTEQSRSHGIEFGRAIADGASGRIFPQRCLESVFPQQDVRVQRCQRAAGRPSASSSDSSRQSCTCSQHKRRGRCWVLIVAAVAIGLVFALRPSLEASYEGSRTPGG
jgi:hypothetical protein